MTTLRLLEELHARDPGARVSVELAMEAVREVRAEEGPKDGTRREEIIQMVVEHCTANLDPLAPCPGDTQPARKA